MTRRELAALLVAVPGVAAAHGAQSQPAAAPTTPADPATAMKEGLDQAVAELDKALIDMTREPAFRFEA